MDRTVTAKALDEAIANHIAACRADGAGFIVTDWVMAYATTRSTGEGIVYGHGHMASNGQPHALLGLATLLSGAIYDYIEDSE